MKKLLSSLMLLLSFSAMANIPIGADDIVGFWLTEESSAVIEIKKVGEKYEGHLVWLKVLHTKEKTEVIDDKNPDEALRSRPVLGLKNLSDFVYGGSDTWKSGTIYDPKKGKTYSAKMTLSEDKMKLDLRGFVGIPLFGRTAHWTREAGPIPKAFQAE